MIPIMNLIHSNLILTVRRDELLSESDRPILLTDPSLYKPIP